MTIPIPTAEIEAATTTDTSRPVLTQVSLQQIHGSWYLAATDSYIAAAVPIDDPGDSEEGLIPPSMLTRARKAAAAASKKFGRYSNGDDVVREAAQLTAKDGKVRLHMQRAEMDGVYGEVAIESERMLGTPPRFEQLLESGGGGTPVTYGTIRVTLNAGLLMRLAKALGAVQGRGRSAAAVLTLDLPINEDGTVNTLRAIRVQPGAAAAGPIGLCMPVRATSEEAALAAWPKPKAKKATTKKATAKSKAKAGSK